MSVSWPPLDTHAHVDVTISPTDLLELRAVIFAATRSLEESRAAIARHPTDLLTVWGLGVHPGVKAALEAFDDAEFAILQDQTAYVGEIGLDGKVRSRLGLQREILRSELTMLQAKPRMTSIHSYGATAEVIDELERTPIAGAVLHWWKGDAELTRRAIDLGAYFSVNAAALHGDPVFEIAPLDRLLLETDHPDGNRRAATPRRPGALNDLETALGDRFNTSPAAIRLATWVNLRRLIDQVGALMLLPSRVGSLLMATPPEIDA